VSIETLKQELSALTSDEQRQLTAFLLSLQNSRGVVYRQKLSDKIDLPASKFASLEELDPRLNHSKDSDAQ